MTNDSPVSSLIADGKLSEKDRQLNKWQIKLLPWLIITPSILVLLFIYLASVQVNSFNKAIEEKEKSIIEVINTATDSVELKKLNTNMDYIKWVTLTKLEEESLHKRYHQGGLLLLSRIFIKYLGFLTGMIISIVGAVFIIGKLSEDTSEIGGTAGENIRLKIVSSSPGVIFGILGTILMLSTILQHNEVSVQDSPLYLNAYGILSLNNQTPQTVSDSAGVNKTIDQKANELFGKKSNQ